MVGTVYHLVGERTARVDVCYPKYCSAGRDDFRPCSYIPLNKALLYPGNDVSIQCVREVPWYPYTNIGLKVM